MLMLQHFVCFSHYVTMLFFSASSEVETEDLSKKQEAVMAAVESMSSNRSSKTEPSAVSNFDLGAYARKINSFLARNFFTMKFIALAIAFIINFMLLFYKVMGFSSLCLHHRAMCVAIL